MHFCVIQHEIHNCKSRCNERDEMFQEMKHSNKRLQSAGREYFSWLWYLLFIQLNSIIWLQLQLNEFRINENGKEYCEVHFGNLFYILWLGYVFEEIHIYAEIAYTYSCLPTQKIYFQKTVLCKKGISLLSLKVEFC